MARIRTIKPSFWGDSSVCRLNWDARLFLIGLISMADDEGRFIATHAAIAGYLFPHEDVTAAKFRRLMNDVTATGIVQLYDVGGRCYGYLPKYRTHQRISKPQKSPLPAPPADGLWSE